VLLFFLGGAGVAFPIAAQSSMRGFCIFMAEMPENAEIFGMSARFSQMPRNLHYLCALNALVPGTRAVKRYRYRKVPRRSSVREIGVPPCLMLVARN
jgi:hypothetical protein